MNVATLPETIAARYAGMKSFRDTAVVTTLFTGERTHQERKAHLRTWFIAPDRLRVEYAIVPDKNPWPRRNFVILRKGADVWLTNRGKTEETSLRAAFVDVYLECHFSLILPALLMPRGTTVPKSAELPKSAMADGEEVIDGRRCHRVQWMLQEGYPRSLLLWADSESYLLHRWSESVMIDMTAGERKAAEENKRLRAIGIPPNLLPEYKKARKHYPFESRTTVEFKPERNPSIDPKVFDPQTESAR